MSAIDEITGALQSVIDELNDAGTAAGNARTEADQAVAQADGLGVTQAVAGLTAVKDSIDKLIQQVHAAAETAHETIGRAKAVADST